ncbi:small ribosomal subunit protein uS2-like [Cornus florida]|uniref:small ribosomal subunit protein uS2-like n=1 Tax=Cornus florida TaxID=4283 RepID=UPI00289962D4|nr:small ribosomal subunit protein uS2-like [Cornus florida]
MAARVVVAIENPHDIIVQSVRPYGQRAVLKFAQYTGAHVIAGRHTPGTFTNQLQTSFSEPRPLKEAALGNIPTIAFCDTDSPMGYVDIGIPANNKGKHNIGCLFWLLARIVLQMRNTIPQGHKWDVMDTHVLILNIGVLNALNLSDGGAPQMGALRTHLMNQMWASFRGNAT